MKCAVCRLVKGMDSRVLGFLFCSSVCHVYDVGGEFLKLCASDPSCVQWQKY